MTPPRRNGRRTCGALRWNVLLFTLVLFIIASLKKSRLIERPTTRWRCQKNILSFTRIGQHGRLGNQLFQVASTIGIAEANGMTWKFPAHISSSSVGRLFGLEG